MTTRTQGIGLMFMALGILVLPGVVINNMSSNNLITPPQTVCPGGQILSQGSCFTCSTGTNSCVLAALVGCQANPNSCLLNGSSIAFLNACSPFTGILTLNFGRFISSFFTNCGTVSNQNVNIQPIAIGTGNWTFSTCTLSGTGTATGDTAPYTTATYFCGAVSPSPFNTPNGTITIGGKWFVQMNIGLGPLGSCIGGVWNGVIGNSGNGTHPTSASTCIQGFVLPTGCTATHCLPISAPQCISGIAVNGTSICAKFITMNSQCLAYGTYGHLYLISSFVCVNLSQPSQFYIPGVSTFFQAFNVASVLEFALSIFGAALLIWLAMGIGFSIGGTVVATGGSVAFNNNPQGTKLAQTLGIGLLIWFPLYSEFSSWFAFMPLGLAAVVTAALVACFFFGVYSLSQSGTAAAQ